MSYSLRYRLCTKDVNWLPEYGSFLRHGGAAGAGRYGPDSPLCAAITPLVRLTIRGLLTITEQATLSMD